MSSREFLLQSQAGLKLSPIESKVFYFPSGSISSYQNSLDYTEEELERSLDKDMADETSFSCPCEFIAYEVNCEGLQKDENPKNFREKTVEKGNITDLQAGEIDSFASELSRISQENKELRGELEKSRREIEELGKTVFFVRNELSCEKSKFAALENDYFKVKIMIEEIVDQDGNSKTARNTGSDPNSCNFLLQKLESLKKSVKPTPDTLVKDLNSQIRQKNSLIISLEGKLNDFLRPVPQKFKDSDDEIHTERPRSTTFFENERITYRDVLRDLREITTRASKALKNSCVNKRASNLSSSNLKEKRGIATDRYYPSPASEKLDGFEKLRRKHLRKAN